MNTVKKVLAFGGCIVSLLLSGLCGEMGYQSMVGALVVVAMVLGVVLTCLCMD